MGPRPRERPPSASRGPSRRWQEADSGRPRVAGTLSSPVPVTKEKTNVSTTLLDALGPLLSGGTFSQVASALGMDERKEASALQVALPALVATQHRSVSSEDGLSSLTHALDRRHDGGVLEDLAGFLSGGGSTDGAKALGHILGDRSEPRARSVGRGTGLDAASVMRLLSLARLMGLDAAA
jgi:hypothetical protein